MRPSQVKATKSFFAWLGLAASAEARAKSSGDRSSSGEGPQCALTVVHRDDDRDPRCQGPALHIALLLGWSTEPPILGPATAKLGSEHSESYHTGAGDATVLSRSRLPTLSALGWDETILWEGVQEVWQEQSVGPFESEGEPGKLVGVRQRWDTADSPSSFRPPKWVTVSAHRSPYAGCGTLAPLSRCERSRCAGCRKALLCARQLR